MDSTANVQSCYTCTGSLSINCASCDGGNYFYKPQKQCVKVCPAGTFPNKLLFTCDSCYISSSVSNTNTSQIFSCATCTGSGYNDCTGCFSGSYLDNSTTSCVKVCPSGTYGDNQTLICQPCYNAKKSGVKGTFNCETCFGPSSTQCLSCGVSLALLTYSSTCTDTCPCQNGYYYDPIERQCGTCSSGCLYCTGPLDADCDFNSNTALECLVGGITSNSQQNLQATGLVAQGGSYSTAVIALTTNILSGGVSIGASTVLSVLSLLGMYQYLNVNYSSNLVLFFQYVFASNPLNFPNLFQYAWQPSAQLLNVDSNVQGNNKFNFYQVSKIFLANEGGDVSAVFFFTSLVPLLLLIRLILMKLKAKNNTMMVMNGLKKFLMWNFILSNFMGSFVPILLFACVQLRYAYPLTGGFEIFSTVLAVFVLIGYIAFMILVVRVVRSVNTPTFRLDIYESVRVLTNDGDETDDSKPLQYIKTKYWALALCTRNFLLVPIIALISESPIAQCTLAMIVNIAFFIVVTRWIFFSSKTKRIIMRICEGFNAIIPILFLMYAINDARNADNPFLSASAQQTIGWLIIILISLVMALSLLYTLTDTWFMLWQLLPLLAKLLKRKCRRTQKVRISDFNSTNTNIIHNPITLVPQKINDIDIVDLGKRVDTFASPNLESYNRSSKDQEQQDKVNFKDGVAEFILDGPSMIAADNSAYHNNSFNLQLEPQLSINRDLNTERNFIEDRNLIFQKSLGEEKDVKDYEGKSTIDYDAKSQVTNKKMRLILQGKQD